MSWALSLCLKYWIRISRKDDFDLQTATEKFRRETAMTEPSQFDTYAFHRSLRLKAALAFEFRGENALLKNIS